MVADNSLRTPGVGETIRTVEIGGVKYGVSIPADGAAGTLATVHSLHGLGVDVHRRFTRIQVTPTIGTAAYVSGDSLGAEMALTNAVRAAGAYSMVRGVVVANKLSATQPRMTIYFADRPIATQTDSSPFSPSDANLLYFTSVLQMANWRTFVDNSIQCTPDFWQESSEQPALPLRANSGTDAYAYAVAEEAATFSNGDLTFTFLIEQF